MIKARLNSAFKKKVQIKRAAILPDSKVPMDHSPVISDDERKQKLQTDFEAIFAMYDLGILWLSNISPQDNSSAWTPE